MERAARDDEIQLIDALRILMKRKAVVLLVATIVVGTAAALVFGAKPRWEAMALLQVGRIGSAEASRDRPIEPVATAVERMRTESFKIEVLGSLKIDGESAEAELYRRSLVVEAVPAPDLLRITVRGFEPGQTRELAEATAERLSAKHKALADPILRSLRARVDELSDELKVTLAEQNKSASEVAVGGTGSAALVANIATLERDRAIRELRQNIAVLSEQSGPNRSYPTGVIGAVSQPVSPVYPNKGLALSVALVVGLCLGALMAFIVDYLLCNRRQPDGR